MNEKGQSISIFRLAIFAIILIALIAIVTTLFPQTQTDTAKEITSLIDFAKSIEGKTVTKLLVLEKDKFFDAKNFDNSTTSISFRCNGLECEEKINSTERTLYAQERIQIQVSARCESGPNLWSCKVYFGKKPAQVEIKGFEMQKEINVSSGEVTGNFEVENTGELPAIKVQTTVKLFRKSFFDGQETLNLFAEPFYSLEQEIIPGSSRGVSFSFPVGEDGSFVLEISSKAQESGFDKKNTEFFTVGAETVNECTATTTSQVLLDEELNECQQKMNCIGCTKALECLFAWQTKLTGVNLEAGSKEFALRIFEPNDGTCN